LLPELSLAVEKIRKHRLTDVDVQGTMRLSTGLLVGVSLSEVAGFTVAIMGREGEWASDGPRERMDINREWIEIGQGEDLAVAVAVSEQIRDDVTAYLRDVRIPAANLVVYSPAEGPARDAIKRPASGLGLAAAYIQCIARGQS
jgi:hypothetical protein